MIQSANKESNEVDRVPSRAKWPPAWMQTHQNFASATTPPMPPQPEIEPTTDHAEPIETPEPENELAIDATDVEQPPACPTCGSLDFWWNIPGMMRCMICHPMTTSRRILELAARFRRTPRRR